MENIKFSVRTNLDKSLKNNEIFQKSLKIDKFRFSSWIVLEFLDRSLILMMAKLRVGTFDSWGRGRGWFGVGIIFLTWIFFFLGHGVCMKFFTHVTPFLSVHWTRVNFCWAGRVSSMQDHRLPRIALHGELSTGQRDREAPKKRYKDNFKQSGPWALQRQLEENSRYSRCLLPQWPQPVVYPCNTPGHLRSHHPTSRLLLRGHS